MDGGMGPVRQSVKGVRWIYQAFKGKKRVRKSENWSERKEKGLLDDQILANHSKAIRSNLERRMWQFSKLGYLYIQNRYRVQISSLIKTSFFHLSYEFTTPSVSAFTCHGHPTPIIGNSHREPRTKEN